MLVCGYFLSDQPDSLSLMYFNPTSPESINIVHKTPGSDLYILTSSTDRNQAPGKTVVSKYFSNEVVIPGKVEILIQFTTEITCRNLFLENYQFLFFREINPPPPKCYLETDFA